MVSVVREGYGLEERREYIRLETVFPIEFRVVSEDGLKPLSGLIQGFTSDIGRGGMCIEVNDLDEVLADNLSKKAAKLSLTIHIPLSGKPVKALATAAWLSKVKEDYPNRYLIGISYDAIDERPKSRIMGYARWLRLRPKIVACTVAVLVVTCTLVVGNNLKLKSQNKALVDRLVYILEKKSYVEGELREVGARKAILEKDLAESNKKISSLEKRIASLDTERESLLVKSKELEANLAEQVLLGERLEKSFEEKLRLEAALMQVLKEKHELEDSLAKISTGRAVLNGKFEELEKQRLGLEALTVERMYEWLKIHQNRRTGLIVSYEGDPSLRDWAFIYDQSLVAQNFVLFGDYEHARRIFNFFKDEAEKVSGWFPNAYYFNSGKVAEYAVNTGPNIWLAIAILQYTGRTGDRGYLELAEQIGLRVIDLQQRDPDGGVSGGPQISWFSTEHNLDAYALFTMLYEVTEDSRYRTAAARAIRWIKDNAYTQSGRIYRGKGDATVATDTFAWAICAIGPEKLKFEGMDPDEILRFAVDNCEVTVDYVRPNGEVVKVTGFDFTKSQNMPRGGVVSSEWTAQMVVAFRVMGEYYAENGDLQKADYYNRKADFYLGELGKLTISSSSWTGQGQGCLPYATQSDVDTGHGWRTPGGKQTGSVAATAYGIFAKRGYNPLMLAAKEESKELVSVSE